MKLLFKQRFSWRAKYDIYDEAGNVMFFVQGEFSWFPKLHIYDGQGREVGLVKQKAWTWLPTYEMYVGGQYLGHIKKEWSFFHPKFDIDYKGWKVEGNWMELDYSIFDVSGRSVATVSKELWKWTDTYVIDVANPNDAL